jgi:predicted anti-sigma-YlaC factor YlaD
MTCQETTLSLGVYLLDALEPAERAVVDAHLATCALCRAELAELAGLPQLLDTIGLEDITPEAVAPSEDLFARVAARARAEDAAPESTRARHRWIVAAAAALVLVVGGATAAVTLHNGADRHSSVGKGPVHMQVTLASQATGTGLSVTVSGLPTDEHCKLIAIAKDGTRDVAGRWDATYQGEANVTGSTSIPRERLAKLVLFGTGGAQLATVPV